MALVVNLGILGVKFTILFVYEGKNQGVGDAKRRKEAIQTLVSLAEREHRFVLPDGLDQRILF